MSVKGGWLVLVVKFIIVPSQMYCSWVVMQLVGEAQMMVVCVIIEGGC